MCFDHLKYVNYMPNLPVVLENRSWIEQFFSLPEHMMDDILPLKDKLRIR